MHDFFQNRLVKYLAFFLLISCFPTFTNAQIPMERRVNWQNAGLQKPIPRYNRIVRLSSFLPTVQNPQPADAALAQALLFLNGRSGVIEFDAGTYTFNQPISLPDSVVLRGVSASATILEFNFNGDFEHCISIRGQVDSFPTAKIFSESAPLSIGDSLLSLPQGTTLSPNDVVWLYANSDAHLVTSSWAHRSVGQILRVQAVENGQFKVRTPLRRTYNWASDQPYLIKMQPRKGVGIECLKIFRKDSSQYQAKNIFFENAVDCWLVGIESYKTNYAHVSFERSANIEIYGCYFNDSYGFGGGGRGYGVEMNTSTGDCRVQNSIFKRLRHAMLLQAGANGNVFAYNFSKETLRTEFPSNGSADISLHGNYAYANLFEGNIAQSIILDNSHGLNGGLNTFFRNKLQLYGIVMSNASDQQNFVGNDIVNTALFYGNYALRGENHFELGNLQNGRIRPESTDTISEISLYFPNRKRPFFIKNFNSNWLISRTEDATNPAADRAADSTMQKTVCDASGLNWAETPISTSTRTSLNFIPKIEVYPNPAQEKIYVKMAQNSGHISLIDMQGRVHKTLINSNLDTEELDLTGCENGLFLVKIAVDKFPVQSFKILVNR
jgi:hypothetical protein